MVLVAGCMMPAPVLRLAPQSKELVWIGGTAVTSQRGQGARAAVAFVREQGNHLAFRVEIESLSDKPILVDPARFYYVTCAQKGQPPTRMCSKSRYVTNPEQALLDLDVAESRRTAGAANDEAFFGAMMLLEATAVVAGATTRHGNGMTAPLIAAGETAASLRAAEQANFHQASAYELERANWSTAALRKSTLFPGGRVAGLVFVEKDPSVSEVSLQIRAGADILPFGFDQTAHQVRFESHRQGRPVEGMHM